MWCNGPMWDSWGMPWGMMFIMPMFFMLAMVVLFFAFRRGFFSCALRGQSHGQETELMEEVRKLRQEVAEIRNKF